MSERVWDSDPCANLIEDLNTLEQAIVEICDIATAQAIYERRRMIRKR
jgi:hypothetical protein